MRTLLLLAITLPLMAQVPPEPAPAGGQAPKPEAKEEAAPTPQQKEQPPTPPPAPLVNWLTGSIDIGWRFVPDIDGNLDTYRTIVNLGAGPKLFGADFTILPTNKRYADRIDVSAHNWGDDPYSTVRVFARKLGLYDFTFDYRNIALFDALPSFDNPGIFNPALPNLNEYSLDTHRQMLQTQLDFFPGKHIIPYVAYDRNRGYGGGTIDFVLPGDEFPVPTSYHDQTNSYRAGVRFEYERWHITLEQGAYNFRDDQRVFQGSQLPNFGNVRTPVLGQTLFLSSGSQAYGVRTEALFSRAMFTANPVSWAELSGSFLFSQPKVDTHFTQDNTGQFFQTEIPLFFNAEMNVINSEVKQPHPSGTANAELRPFNGRLRILETWMTDRLHDASLLQSLDQLIVSGQAPVILNTTEMPRFETVYNQQELNILYDVTSRLTLRGGHRYVWGHTVAPASVTILGLNQPTERGELKRNVALASVGYRTPVKFRGNVYFEASPGDREYYRTSLNEYQRARVLGQYNPISPLQFTFRFNVLHNSNPDPAIRYDFQARETALSVYYNPSAWKGFAVLADYTRETIHSNIIFLLPFNLQQAISNYSENAHIASLLAEVPFSRWKAHAPLLRFGGSLFKSSGSRPTAYYQPLAQLAFPVTPHVQLYGEWQWYGYGENLFPIERFTSHQFVTALRFTL